MKKNRINRCKAMFALIFVLFLCLMPLTMTGCARRGTCESCQQEAALKKYVCTGWYGSYDEEEAVYLCDDCLRLYKLMGY